MFLVMIERLRKMIQKAKDEGRIQGITVGNDLFITHILSIDDVLLFIMGYVEEWQSYKDILDCFCARSGMEVSMEKWIYMSNNMQDSLIPLKHYFPLTFWASQ